MTRYFMLFTPGQDDMLLLDRETIIETFANPSVLTFVSLATPGEARLFGDQVVVRLDHTAVQIRRDGKIELKKSGNPLVGKTAGRSAIGI